MHLSTFALIAVPFSVSQIMGAWSHNGEAFKEQWPEKKEGGFIWDPSGESNLSPFHPQWVFPISYMHADINLPVLLCTLYIPDINIPLN